MEIIPVGENWFSILVRCERTADCARRIRAMRAGIADRGFTGIESLRVGLDCLFIEASEGFDITHVQTFLQDFQEEQVNVENPGSLGIPVCCDPEYAPDLEDVCQFTSLSVEEVIEKFCSSVYQVWMIGFMPGYPYMGSLDPALQIARKRTPAVHVAARSVAIADEFAGVYPFDSPGGWHVIGRTPLSVIDYSKARPWLFDYGMNVRFYQISKDEFLDKNRW